MNIAYIALGSNLGNRAGYIQSAIKSLEENEHIELSRTGNIIETEPLGQMDQPKYLNAVAEIKTSLTPESLHKKLIEIEISLGRIKKQKWASRIIDLDLLLFGQQVINHSDLTIPHPQMHLRSFVLSGLCRLNPDLLHPVLKEPVTELAKRLNGRDFVLNPNIPQLVSIAGIIGVGKTTLAENLSKLLGCKCIFEAYDKNPFLPQVYAGQKQLALNSQLFFLTSRVEQLNCSALTKGQVVISDYVFDKELIYANRLLDAQQLSLYKKIYPPFAVQATKPVLVIYLTDSVRNCLDRIHKRNRPYEQKITIQFLEDLRSGHQELFNDWKTCPVISLSMSDFNYMDNGHLQHLANQIKCYTTCPSVILSAPVLSKVEGAKNLAFNSK